jgi:enoyl-CoA hydratase/carnithine racemase
MSDLIVQKDGPLKRLTLNRPEKRNALSLSLAEVLLEHIQESETDGTRLLVLKGNGSSFCAGFDLGNFTESSPGDLLLHFVRIEQMLQALAYASFDTAAFVHGNVVGAGADLAVACGHKIAEANSKFMFPGARFGLILGTRRLARCIGGQQASRLVGGPSIDAEEALRIGLIDSIGLEPNQTAYENQLLESLQETSISTRKKVLNACRVDSRSDDMRDLVNSASSSDIKNQLDTYFKKLASKKK